MLGKNLKFPPSSSQNGSELKRAQSEMVYLSLEKSFPVIRENAVRV